MIPKKVHYCWFSQDPLGDLQQKCLRSWKKHLPDYELIHWKMSDLPMNIHYIRKMVQKKRWAYLSDYMRLYALYHHGGIYLDLDVEVLKSFDSLLNNQIFLGWEDPNPEYEAIEAHVIGSVPSHFFLQDCMNFYEKNLFLKISHPPFMPSLLLKITKKKYNYTKFLPREEITLKNNLKLYPYPYFSPMSHSNTDKKNYKQYIQNDSYTIHHWHHGWTPSGLEHLKYLPWAFMSFQEWKRFLIYFFGAIYRNRKRLFQIIKNDKS